MKKITIPLLLSITATAVLYLCFSFVKLTLNFAEWGQEVRELFCFLFVVIGIVLPAVFYFIKEEDKNGYL